MRSAADPTSCRPTQPPITMRSGCAGFTSPPRAAPRQSMVSSRTSPATASPRWGFLMREPDGTPPGTGEDAAALSPVGEDCVRADIGLDAAAVAATAQPTASLDEGMATLARAGMRAALEPTFGDDARPTPRPSNATTA